MPDETQPARSELPLDVLDRIDRICDRFEVAWDRGERPRIEVMLRAAIDAAADPNSAARDLGRAEPLIASLGAPDGSLLYDLACAQAAFIGPSPPARRESYTDRALGALRRAIAAGYRDAEQMKTDPDLAPIRGHPVFPSLLRDAAMPEDPFAR